MLKIAISPFFINSKPHKHIELPFIHTTDIEVQWSSSFHPSSSIFEYGYNYIDMHNQLMHTYKQLLRVQRTVSLVSQSASFHCTVNFQLHKIIVT